MNILFLSTHLNAGGITSYLFILTKGLTAKGHKVFVVTSGGDREDDFRGAGANVITLNIKTKSDASPKIYLALPKLKKIAEENNIDIIHANTRITQVMGKLLSLMTKKAYVSTCHGFFKRRLSRRLAPCWGDKTISISEQVSGHLKNDFHVNERSISLVEHGVDVEAYPNVEESEKIAIKKKYDLSGENIIGIIARLSDVKGQDVMVSAMKDILKVFPDAKLLLVGQGKMENQLRGMIDSLELKNSVRILSVVKNIKEVLSILDVFVMPSRQEGLGISIMEAQAAGLPVVASRVGGIPSLIADKETGILVESENEKDLGEAIIEVLKDKKMGADLGRAAKEFILKNYSIERMVGGTLDVYTSVKRD